MTYQPADERGSAMVLALGVLAVLALLSIVVVMIASSEKWTESGEYAHSRAFYSADAAGEAGLNWVRAQGRPPSILDANRSVYLSGGYTPLSSDHNYKYDVRYLRKHFRPGWSLEYKDYEYAIEADGASARQSEAAIEVRATRLFKEGYQ